MCGIVGYTGWRDAYPILIKGLKRLEYRGYDSAGVALQLSSKELAVYKTKGKVANLENATASQPIDGLLGIAHTRWATHGEPSERNAHPHYSENREIALVHNGIIENYRELKRSLIAEGYSFQSDTDTEVLVQLIEFTKEKYQLSLFRAVQEALRHVIGAYAIAVIDKQEPQHLVAARKSSPLAIGVGEDNREFFLASDSSPIIEYTRNIIFVNDEDIVELVPGQTPYIETLSSEVIEPQINKVTLDLGMIEKDGHPHFMIKEILDQPRVLCDCMRGRVNSELKEVVLSSVVDHRDRLLSARRIVIVGCGTSWHAALIGKRLIENLARIPVEVEYSSEFRYRNPIIDASDVVVAMSQSGETADTLAAIRLAKERGAFIYGICNSVGSSIARTTDSGTYIHVGPEIGVASTKAFTGQVLVLTLLALSLGRANGTLDKISYEQIIDDLAVLPDKMKEILEQKDMIERLASRFTYAHNFIYLGRGINFPVALEGALKLKEISYIHAEGYPAAEMKHGPIALIDEEMPIVVIATRDKIYEKIVSNIQEIKARKGRIIAIVNKGDTQVRNMVDFVIEVPTIAPDLEPLLTVIPLQLLSYYIAVCKGKDVDQPRNLAKSVTVE